MSGLRGMLFRAFVFTREARGDVLDSLAVQTRAGIAAGDAFELQRQVSKDHQVKRLADMALSSIGSGKPFASLFASSGYFPAPEARLLEIGERHNGLVKVIELMRRESDPAESFAGVVVAGNMQWIGALVAMLAMTMYATGYEAIMTLGAEEERQAFFLIGEWLNGNLWWVVALSLLLGAAYLAARRRVTGGLRQRLRELGLFGAADRRDTIRLCELLSTLFDAGVAPKEALVEAVAVRAPGGGGRSHAEASLTRALAELAAGTPLNEALGHALEDRHVALLRLQSGRSTPEELARAFATVADVTRNELRKHLRALSAMVGGTAAILSFVLLVPMIQTLMGAGSPAISNRSSTKEETMKSMRRERDQRGFTTMQVLASLAIAGVLTGTALALLAPAYQTAVLNGAYDEIVMISNSARLVREYDGDYADLANVEWLTDNGYLANPPYDDGLGENRLGNNFTVVRSNAAGDDVTITYVFDENEQCLQVEDRVDRSIAGQTVEAACAAGTLTFTLN